MNYNDQLIETSRFLKENDHFLVVNHVNPDGDAVGSLLAMGYILKKLGKHFTLVNEGATPVKFQAEPLQDLTIQNVTETPLSGKYRTVITVDCGDLVRVGTVANYFDPDAKILNIDHHPTNDYFGTVNLIRTDACATAEILFDLIKAMSVVLDKELATALYMGILTDTGGFRYSNTSSEVMEKASELLRYGVDPAMLAERCLESITFSYLQLLQLVLPTLTMHKDNQIAFLTISKEAQEKCGAGTEDMEGMVNYTRNIEGVEVGVIFKQIDDQRVKVSLRSKRNVDVSAIAHELGGGGHAKAAGCTIYESMEKAQSQVLQKIEDFWR